VGTVSLHGNDRGQSVDLDSPEMGIVWTTLITGIASGVSAAVKGISKAVKKKKAAKAERQKQEEETAKIAATAASKGKTMKGVLIVGGLVAVGAGAILLTGRR
jgi:hypothetical protein